MYVMKRGHAITFFKLECKKKIAKMVLTTKCTTNDNTQKKNFFPVGNFTYCSFICNLELNDPQKNIMKSTLKNFSEISRKSTLYKYRSLRSSYKVRNLQINKLEKLHDVS